MKLLTMISVLFSIAAFATESSPQFSAFTSKGQLYVTILGDTCNNFIGRLEVDALCNDDRMTRNHASVCEVSLSVISTKMACGPGVKPRVLTMDLQKAKVAKEAVLLKLNYRGQELEVPVNR